MHVHVHLTRNDPLPTEALGRMFKPSRCNGMHVHIPGEYNKMLNRTSIRSLLLASLSPFLEIKFGGKIKREEALALPLALRQHTNIF